MESQCIPFTLKLLWKNLLPFYSFYIVCIYKGYLNELVYGSLLRRTDCEILSFFSSVLNKYIEKGYVEHTISVEIVKMSQVSPMYLCFIPSKSVTSRYVRTLILKNRILHKINTVNRQANTFKLKRTFPRERVVLSCQNCSFIFMKRWTFQNNQCVQFTC